MASSSGRNALAERGGARRRGREARERDRRGAVAGERPLPGERLEQDDAQGVDVRGDRRGLATRLLRAEVVDRPHRRARERQLRLVERACDPEVRDLDPPVAAHEDVRGLDVAVDDAADVRGLEGLRGLCRHAGGLARGERSVAAEDRRQVLALDDLHDQVRPGFALAEVEHGHDVGVVERCGSACLVAESGEEVGVLAELRSQQLDRHVAIELRIAGAVDGGHPALAEQLHQAVPAAERRPDLGHGVGSLPSCE